jgi:hypothetical protein
MLTEFDFLHKHITIQDILELLANNVAFYQNKPDLKREHEFALVKEHIFEIFDFLSTNNNINLNPEIFIKLYAIVIDLEHNKQIELINRAKDLDKLYDLKLQAEKEVLNIEYEVEELGRFKRIADLLVKVMN